MRKKCKMIYLGNIVQLMTNEKQATQHNLSFTQFNRSPTEKLKNFAFKILQKIINFRF